jgi:hypothetical protein
VDEGHHINVLLIPAGCLILLGMAFFALFARLTSRRRINRFMDNTEALFSPSRYRALELVLDEADQNFLQMHSCCDASMKKRFRKIRAGIFRRCLCQLDDDFNRICRAITVLMVASETDRPDLAGIMMKQKLFFAVRMASVECKLVFYGLGWSKVGGRGLITTLDSMRCCLQTFAAMVQPAAA